MAFHAVGLGGALLAGSQVGLRTPGSKENILRKAWCVPSPQALGCERSETGHVVEPGEDGVAGSQEAGGLQIASGCLRGCGVLFSRCRKTFDGM